MYTLIKAIATPEVPHTQLAFLQLFAQESQYKGICAPMCVIMPQRFEETPYCQDRLALMETMQ